MRERAEPLPRRTDLRIQGRQPFSEPRVSMRIRVSEVELQRELEILAEANVKTTEQAYMFYLREAATVRDAFETRAAIEAGLAVERELGRGRSR